jgi:hypothetical protein
MMIRASKKMMIIICGIVLATSSICKAKVLHSPAEDFFRGITEFFELIFSPTPPQKTTSQYRFVQKMHTTSQPTSAPQQTKTLKEEDIENIRQNVLQAINSINADYASEHDRIFSAILKNLRPDNRAEFAGSNLNEKVRFEMTKIHEEQHDLLKKAHKNKPSHQPSKIAKLFTSETCCVCLESFATLGKRRYLDPCGHDICPSCYAQLTTKTCPLCRTEIRGYEDVTVQSDHNPEIDNQEANTHR